MTACSLVRIPSQLRRAMARYARRHDSRRRALRRDGRREPPRIVIRRRRGRPRFAPQHRESRSPMPGLRAAPTARRRITYFVLSPDRHLSKSVRGQTRNAPPARGRRRGVCYRSRSGRGDPNECRLRPRPLRSRFSCRCRDRPRTRSTTPVPSAARLARRAAHRPARSSTRRTGTVACRRRRVARSCRGNGCVAASSMLRVPSCSWSRYRKKGIASPMFPAERCSAARPSAAARTRERRLGGP